MLTPLLLANSGSRKMNLQAHESQCGSYLWSRQGPYFRTLTYCSKYRNLPSNVPEVLYRQVVIIFL
jgi:hypothetical protein